MEYKGKFRLPVKHGSTKLVVPMQIKAKSTLLCNNKQLSWISH